MRFNAEQKRWTEFFDEISVNFCGKRYVEIPKLIKAMDAKLQHIDEKTRKKLYYLLDYDGDLIISDNEFKNLMKIWSAFSANDINNDDVLDANEIKTLFWLFDGKKPSREKIMRETKIMDEDKSGTIDRLEWLAYLCSAGEGKDKDYYDFKLRSMFEKADSGKNGYITVKQLNEFVKMDLEK